MAKVQSYQLMGTQQGTELMTSVITLQSFNSYSYFGLFPSLNWCFWELTHRLTWLATHLLNLFLAG